MSKYSNNIPPSLIAAIGWFYDDIPEGSTVLDFGCSTGYYGEYIKKNKNAAVYGVEISEDRFEAAKILDGVYSFDLDGEWPPEVYERKYDVIFYGDVIEHLKDPEEALRKAKKLLTPNGKVFVSTPNIAHTSIRLELLGGNFEYESMGILDNTHLKYFTLSSLTKLVINAGYSIDRIDYSISDYPKEIVQELLNKYGLKAGSKFWEMLRQPTARAFQHKFVLSPLKPGVKKAKIPTPAVKPEEYKADYIRNLLNEINSLREASEAQSKEITKVSNTLSTVTNSKAYKLAQKMQRAKGALKGKKS
jgi:SAM-dependent methyltransferase